MYMHDWKAKKLDPKAVTGIFLCYGTSMAVLYYLDPHKETIKRAHRAKIDSLEIGGSNDTPGSNW